MRDSIRLAALLFVALASSSCSFGTGRAEGASTPGGSTPECTEDSDCTQPATSCAGWRCDRESGACVTAPEPDGTVCNDGGACVVGEACVAGECTGGEPVDCAGAGTRCRADSSCDPLGSEGNCALPGEPIHDGLACDSDGVFCNGVEVCAVGECVSPGSPCAPGEDSCVEVVARCLPSSCVPAEVQVCDCTDGSRGTRSCLPGGTTFGPCLCQRYGAELFVDSAAAAGGDGSAEHPFKSPADAVARVVTMKTQGLPDGGVGIWIAPGTYELRSTLTLGTSASGEVGKPVVLRGGPGGIARLTGARSLPASAFVPVTAVTPRFAELDPAVAPKILVADLKAQGITDFGTLVQRGMCTNNQRSALELYVDGERQTLARWPDAQSDDDPSPTADAEELTLFGLPDTVVPDVTGLYRRSGTSDGVNTYQRQGLVGGKQYSLYRHRWQSGGNWNTAWFLTSDASGYPTNAAPWWRRDADTLGPMLSTNGAKGTVKIAVSTGVRRGFARLAGRSSNTVFTYAGDHPTRWSDASGAWLHGFWKYAWADCHVPMGTIDGVEHTVTLDAAPGYGLATGQPWYAYNLLEELTVPGEYYVDRTSGLLYFYPPAPLDTQSSISVSMRFGILVVLEAASNVELRDLEIDGGRSDLVALRNAHDVLLAGLSLHAAGTRAINLDGSACRVSGCTIDDTAAAAIEVTGGDRKTLTGGGNFIERSVIRRYARWEWAYHPGVRLDGVGHVVRNNLIFDAPYIAIMFWGNDHLIELNEIHHVLQFSSDTGAIYTGRDWGFRGNRVRHNFIHDISTAFEGYGAHAVYLDDCASGIEVTGNIILRVQNYAVLHGGGRDDVVEGNVIAHCGTGISADARCFTRLKNGTPNNNEPGDSWSLLKKLQKVGYQEEPWLSRYPACAAMPDDWATIINPSNTWLYPEGTTFAGNLGYANTTWMKDTGGAFSHYADKSGNLEVTDSPFADEDALDCTLRDGVTAGIPGFEPIPFSEMGVR